MDILNRVDLLRAAASLRRIAPRGRMAIARGTRCLPHIWFTRDQRWQAAKPIERPMQS